MQQGLLLETGEADLSSLPLSCCVTLGKLLSFSGPRFPHLSSEDAPAPKGTHCCGHGSCMRLQDSTLYPLLPLDLGSLSELLSKEQISLYHFPA